MSQGEPWVDEIMRPLSGIGASLYNPIYSAVSRGTPQQGRGLIEAITKLARTHSPDCDSILSASDVVAGITGKPCNCATLPSKPEGSK